MRTLEELAERDPRLVLLTGDLGYSVLESFAKRFPDRFVNVGVAEQNLLAVATGLAEAGFLPFVYSIASFAALRPYEFIRNGPVHHRLPVRILGVGGGFEYGTAGASHHGLEDLGAMRLLPDLIVLAPADAEQASAALRATWDLPDPLYLRLGKDEHARVAGLTGRFRLGRAEQLATGDELLLVTAGAVAVEVAAARAQLAERGVSAGLLVAASLQPAPRDDLAAALDAHRVALVVESHYAVGGLGSLVAEVAAERGLGCRVVRHGVCGRADAVMGSSAHLLRAHRLDRIGIAETAWALARGGR